MVICLTISVRVAIELECCRIAPRCKCGTRGLKSPAREWVALLRHRAKEAIADRPTSYPGQVEQQGSPTEQQAQHRQHAAQSQQAHRTIGGSPEEEGFTTGTTALRTITVWSFN